jgi:hypothetical protein
MIQYVTPERINLRAHPDYNEKWVQARIAENVGILGLVQRFHGTTLITPAE